MLSYQQNRHFEGLSRSSGAPDWGDEWEAENAVRTKLLKIRLSLSDAEAGFQVRHNGEQEADACTKMPVGSMEVPGDSSAGNLPVIHAVDTSIGPNFSPSPAVASPNVSQTEMPTAALKTHFHVQGLIRNPGQGGQGSFAMAIGLTGRREYRKRKKVLFHSSMGLSPTTLPPIIEEG
ncbi:hypothetical protein ACCO45_012807 [Purpureocillium lilacinum]|uniref:Uncharacterized protein n=1 Tax=Purpureocillium lilacinum TaxID=33203 RepID=A0ACC4D976_PURLI